MPAAVLLDRDGVITENRDDYVKSWAEVELLPGALEAVARLAATQYRIVIITNQSAIGRGLTTREAVEDIHRRLGAEISARGGRVDAVYYCPHRPDEGCACRKPRPGLLLRAARELELDLAASVVVGDAVSDVEAALAAGCPAILVRTGRGRAQEPLLRQRGDAGVLVVDDLSAAVAAILETGTGEGAWSARQDAAQDRADGREQV